MMSFIPPLPIRNSSFTHPRHMGYPPRRARYNSMHASLSPSMRSSASTPMRTEDSVAQLKERSIITLRGLSDLGGAALLHELCGRLLLSPNPNMSMIADSELLLGGLMGVWTAAVFAERLREKTASLIRESEELPSRWDSTVLYTPALEEDDVQHAVAWLYAFDELEGLAAADLLRSLAESDNSAMRFRLAQALGAFPMRSNVTLSLLTLLAEDLNRVVRDAAAASLDAYESAFIIEQSKTSLPVASRTRLRSASGANATAGLADARSIDEEIALRAVLERVVNDPKPVLIPALEAGDFATTWHGYDVRWLRDVMSRQVGSMRDAALSQPELPDLSRYAPCLLAPYASSAGTLDGVAHLGGDGSDLSEDGYVGDVSDVDGAKVQNLKSAAPLMDSLRWSEIHGICALALFPALYELFAVVDGESLPLRFVGLGWLLALGGLMAYPQSARIWSELAKAIERMPRVKP